MTETTALQAWHVAVAVIHTISRAATEAEIGAEGGSQDAELWADPGCKAQGGSSCLSWYPRACQAEHDRVKLTLRVSAKMDLLLSLKKRRECSR